jgi:hypothetical protein
LLVEQRVPWVSAQDIFGEVLLSEGRQDADHDDAGADLARLRVRGVQVVPQGLLELRGRGPGQPPRLDVELDVELTELRHEVRVRDAREHLAVDHRRVAEAVDEVELDLQAGHGPLEVEA